MLSDSFEVVSCLSTSEIKCFRATERATGREVLIHLLPRADSPSGSLRLVEVLLRHIVELPPEYRTPILQTGEWDARLIGIVTGLPDDVFQSSSTDWLNEYVRLQTPSAPAVSNHVSRFKNSGHERKEEPSQSSPGNFTRMFGSPISASESETPLPSPPTPSRTQPDSPPRSGEFTRLFSSPLGSDDFRTSDPTPPHPAPRQSTNESTNSPAPESSPGQFTQLFRSSDIRSSDNEKPNAYLETDPPSRDSGSFTTLFPRPEKTSSSAASKKQGDEGRTFSTQTQVPREHEVPPDDSSLRAMPPHSPVPTHRGDAAATQLFRMPDPSTSTPKPDRDAGPSEFTRVVAMPRSQTEPPPVKNIRSESAMPNVSSGVSMPSVSPPSLQGPSASVGSVSGPSFSSPSVNPGGFTPPSVSGSSALATLPSAPSPAAPAQVPSAATPASAANVSVPRSLLYLILTMNVLFIIALIIVVYFALNK